MGDHELLVSLVHFLLPIHTTIKHALSTKFCRLATKLRYSCLTNSDSFVFSTSIYYINRFFFSMADSFFIFLQSAKNSSQREKNVFLFFIIGTDYKFCYLIFYTINIYIFGLSIIHCCLFESPKYVSIKIIQFYSKQNVE